MAHTPQKGMDRDCAHCHTHIAADHDAVHLAGRCGHHLHLTCYDKRRALGVRSTCCDGQSTDLGDVLTARLFNPLSAPSDSAASVSRTTDPTKRPATRNYLGGVMDAFTALDGYLESKINHTAASAIRIGTPVHTLLESNIDATAIVKDPANPLIAPLIAEYSTAQLVALGFNWAALLAVGFSRKTWDRQRWPVARLAADLKIGPDHVLQGLCAGQASEMPSLGLTALEWQQLCGPEEVPADFFKRAGLDADSFLEFRFNLDAWRYQLGLQESPIARFGLTVQQCWTWLDESSVDAATVQQQFRFLFNAEVPERPSFQVLPEGDDGEYAEHPVAPERRPAAPAAPASRAGRGRGPPHLWRGGLPGRSVYRGARPGLLQGARGHGPARGGQPQEGEVMLKFVHLGEEGE